MPILQQHREPRLRLIGLAQVDYFHRSPVPGNRQAAQTAEKAARERELSKVPIEKEDVDLIVNEFEIPKAKAERTLREHGGNVVEALASLTN